MSLRDHNLNFVYVSSVNERLTENFTRRHEGTKKNKDGKDAKPFGGQNLTAKISVSFVSSCLRVSHLQLYVLSIVHENIAFHNHATINHLHF